MNKGSKELHIHLPYRLYFGKGDPADFAIFDSLSEFNVQETYITGEKLATELILYSESRRNRSKSSRLRFIFRIVRENICNLGLTQVDCFRDCFNAHAIFLHVPNQ